jgi:hypothetical protein
MLNEALKRVMESKNLSEEEVTTAFAEFVKENYPEIWTQAGQNIGNLDEEDLDFFSSAFEVNSVRRKGSGGKGDTWVGMIVAYDGTRDMMQRQRDTAIDAAEINLGQALRYGIRQGEKSIGIGRVVKQDGEWVVKSADDSLLYKESASDDKMPLWVIAINNGASHICLLKDDGRSPKRAFMKKRKWLFIGNTQDKFLSEGALPPMTLECSFGASEVELQMLRPITFKAEMEKAWKPAGSDEPDENQLVALDIDPDYGLGWVDDEILPKVTQLFAPDQFIANFMPTVDLANVFDYHMENRKVLSSGKDFGPLFAISGTVDYIDHAGKENLYTEGGFKHSITLTSNSLRREDANANLWIDVSRYLVEKQHAFQVKKADGWKDYASGSRLWVIVRSRTWNGTDGSVNLNLDAKGVYAMPLRSIVAKVAPANANDISHTDAF